MTKDEALKMCLEYIETNAHERRHVRWAIKEALATNPPQRKLSCQKEDYKKNTWRPYILKTIQRALKRLF